MKKLLTVVSVASIPEQEIENALSLEWDDFEDSVQYSVAFLQEMEGIVTRNPNDYKEARIKIWKPEELLLGCDEGLVGSRRGFLFLLSVFAV